MQCKLVKALCYKPEGRRFDFRSRIFFYFTIASNLTIALRLTQPLTQMNTSNIPGRVNRCRRMRLTNSTPSVSRLSRTGANLDVSKSYRPPRPVTRIALLLYSAIHIYLKKLALTSPTSGGHSVGRVRLQTKATELVSSFPALSGARSSFSRLNIMLTELRNTLYIRR
jgi:hypothetical protein